jgi:hypothetical protein
MGLWWVNVHQAIGFNIHRGFVNRSGVFQSNAGATAVFELNASISG